MTGDQQKEAAKIPVSLGANGTVSISDIEVIYVDSRSALETAWAQGLPRNVEIRTSSPRMLLDPDLGAVASDAAFTPDRLQNFYQEAKNWSKSLYAKLAKKPGSEDFALLTAHRASRFQTPIYKLMALREEDFHRPVAAITYDVADPHRRVLLNPAVAKVLCRSQLFLEIRLPESILDFQVPMSGSASPLLDRLRTSTLSSIGHRAALRLWNQIPFNPPKGTILILDENSLLKETAFVFATRGYRLHQLKSATFEVPPPASPKATEFIEKLRPLISEQLRKWLLSEAVAPATELLESEIRDYITRYEATLKDWRTQLRSLADKKPRAVFANRVYPAEAVSLSKAAREVGIPMVCFAHGVSREIGLVGHRDEIWFETLLTDLFLTHTKECADFINDSSLNGDRAIAVGLGRDFEKAGHLRATNRGSPPIWYIATLGHIGNFTMLNRGMRDFDQTVFEMKMVDDVLSKLPHKVLYKPYPSRHYDGPDPVMERARQAQSIETYEEGRYLRYIIRNSSVLITARTSSTVSVCVMSGKPVVYILFPGRPLSPAARAAMEKGVFVFDSEDPKFWDDLREFLSQPIEMIQNEWQMRAGFRKELIKNFFDEGEGRAAVHASDLLEQSEFDPSRMVQ